MNNWRHNFCNIFYRKKFGIGKYYLNDGLEFLVKNQRGKNFETNILF